MLPSLHSEFSRSDARSTRPVDAWLGARTEPPDDAVHTALSLGLASWPLAATARTIWRRFARTPAPAPACAIHRRKRAS